MKKVKLFIPFIFPVLILFFGLIIYKIMGYEPNFYTIAVNIGVAYFLSPRLKKIKKQNSTQTQVTWLFYKKVI
tara:strand:- start:709 stop:927 length:219 start_codon:yes stop_codon:yes gene_type:complete